MPKSLVVMGSGAIGMSSGRSSARLGGDGRRAPAADPAVENADFVSVARKHFEKQGIKIFTGAPPIPFAGAVGAYSSLPRPHDAASDSVGLSLESSEPLRKAHPMWPSGDSFSGPSR